MFSKLKQRIKDDIGIDLIGFRRCYPSSSMLSSGAFTWVAHDPVTKHIYGSTDTATNLVNQSTPLKVVEELDRARVQHEIQ